MRLSIRHKSLGRKTYQQLKHLIVSNRIKPGERLLYKDLVTRLNVSQTPIKEAFTRLENEGYVVTIPRRGTFVREHSREDIRDIFQVREMLEALAARLASQSDDSGLVAKLEKANSRFRAAFQNRDVDTCTKEDYNFHEVLINYSGNRKLKEIMQKSNLHLLSIVESSGDFWEIADEYYTMHTEILRAIKVNDPDLAEKLIRSHIRYGQRHVLAALE